MKKDTFNWFALDNAGKIFPGQNTRRWSNVFRMGIELKEDIDPVLLKEALDKTLERIPCFNVRIRKGAFWFYFERNKNSCPVLEDVKNHSYRINFKENQGFLLRVYYLGRRINLDVYHAVADGYGAAVFLCTLAGEYLRLKGNSISCNQFVLDVESSPQAEEMEDGYNRHASSDEKYNRREPWVYHKKGTKLPAHMCNYTILTLSFKELHSVCKKYSVTVTELFAAVLTEIHYRRQLASGKKPREICVQVPVNVRKAFPSATLRNFVLCLRVRTLPKSDGYTFDEILSNVSSELRRVNTPRLINSLMTQNLKIEKQAGKYIPLFLKTLGVAIGFGITAEQTTTALLSNMGPIILPEDMQPHIEKMMFFTGPGKLNGARCGVISCSDRLTFTFSNCYKENDIEREFISKLTELGVNVSVETNRDLSDFDGLEGVAFSDNVAFSDKIHIPLKSEAKVRFPKSDTKLSERLERVFHL